MLAHALTSLCETTTWARLRVLTLAPLAAAALALAACGGGGGGAAVAPPANQACNAQTCGTLLVGLTDADGDFLSYSVDVVALSLRRADGTIVQTLPVRQRVDFAGLVDLTELVTAATIPNGTYVRAAITLDYSNAEVSVELNGAPVAANVVNAAGQALGTVTLELMLDNRNHVLIAPGRPALLQLDFDLAASHDVDFSTTPATATAQPFIVATIEPVEDKELRVRGPLVSVDTNASQYVIDLRPFDHLSARLGNFTVKTNAATAFEIDGVEFEGAAGLAQLAGKPAGTPTKAFGVLNIDSRTFTASDVLAGDSVPGPRFDVVRGSVIARSGDELTVRGGTVVRRDGSVRFFRGDITVLVGPDTIVTRDGGGRNLLRPIAISVGQRINAFGQVTATPTVDTLTLDATNGRVRMKLTHLLGSVVSANPGLVTLDLFAIDRLRPSAFDFAGTGSSAANDADPENYEVATGLLPLPILSLTPDSPARVFGFVTPFGLAPPDFVGRTIVDFNGLRAVMGVGWGENGTAAPFLSMGDSGLVIDQDNPDLGLRHHIKVGPRIVDITALASPVTVAPASGRTLFAIGEPGNVELFREWAPFVTRLAEKLGGGARARALFAQGRLEPGDLTLTANYVAVAVVRP
ncbi:MAG: DUF4382 domain-containing protein [Gammaproteobacteria bacterium]